MLGGKRQLNMKNIWNCLRLSEEEKKKASATLEKEFGNKYKDRRKSSNPKRVVKS